MVKKLDLILGAIQLEKHGKDGLAQALNALELQGLLHSPVDVFCEELKALRASSAPYFRKFDQTDDDNLRDLDFSEAFALVRQVAPQWHKTQLALTSSGVVSFPSSSRLPRRDRSERNIAWRAVSGDTLLAFLPALKLPFLGAFGLDFDAFLRRSIACFK
jgi:hypothetical protein